MAKSHKYAWTGVDVETTLSFEQLANMAERAAQQSTGDLSRGRFRIVSTRNNERRIEFLITDYLVSYKKCMVFHLDFVHRDGRTWLTSNIDWYESERAKIAGIPAGGKAMVAHHAYMQFAHSLANQVRAADSRARVTIREGKQPKVAGPPQVVVATPERHPADSTKPGLSISRPVPSARLEPVRSVGGSWQLLLPDGTVVPIAAAIVVGRNPVPPSTAPSAEPVSLQDQWLSVSKTHALLEVRDDTLWVTDLCSTNGTRLRERDGNVIACKPDTPQPIADGCLTGFGEFWVRTIRA